MPGSLSTSAPASPTGPRAATASCRSTKPSPTGAKRGAIEEACAGVYRDRIKRGTAGNHAAYSTKKLGLLGLDLAAVASFFIEPWRRLAPELTPAAQVLAP